MPREILVATSMLSADFTRLGEEAKALVDAGTDWLHWDCMDGHFTVPLTHGPLVLKAIRPLTDLYFDAHLMVSNPERQIPLFAEAGADGIAIHIEATDDPAGLLRHIRDLGRKSCLTVNPPTPLADVERLLDLCDVVMIMGVNPGYAGQQYGQATNRRIAQVREAIDRRGLPTLIEVDGGVHEETARGAIAASADVIDSASYVFKHPQGDAAAIKRLREIAAYL